MDWPEVPASFKEILRIHRLVWFKCHTAAGNATKPPKSKPWYERGSFLAEDSDMGGLGGNASGLLNACLR